MFDVLAISTVRSSSGRAVRGSSRCGHLLEDVGHLVAALAAADVDDHVGVAPLRDLLQQDGLAGPEAARHGGAAAARDREEEVERALARCAAARRRRRRSRDGPRPPHRPLRARGTRLGADDARDRVGDRVRARRRDPLERSAEPERDEQRGTRSPRSPAPRRGRRPAATSSPTEPTGVNGQRRASVERPRAGAVREQGVRPRRAAAASRRRRRRAGPGRASARSGWPVATTGSPGRTPPVYA